MTAPTQILTSPFSGAAAASLSIGSVTGAHKIIHVGILDDQGNDAAMKSYTKIVRKPLAGLSCRPATVTLWAPPNSGTSIDIP
jgi:hypothetical protein